MFNLGNISRTINSGFSQINTITSNVNSLTANLNTSVNGALSGVTSQMSGLTGGLQSRIPNFSSQVNNLTGQLQSQANYLIPNLNNISTALQSPVNQLKQQLNGVTQGLNGSLDQALGGVRGQFDQALGGLSGQLTGSLNQALGGVSEDISSKLNNVTGNLNNAFAQFGNANQLMQPLNANLNSLTSQLDAFGGIGDSITDQISSISGSVNSDFNSFLSGSQDKLNGILNSGINGALSNITTQLDNFANPLANIDGIISNFESTINNVVSVATGDLQSTIEGFLDNPLNAVFGENGFTGLEQFLSGITNSGIAGGNGVSPGNTGSSSQRQPNLLRDYNTYNYIITLGILGVDEYNSPSTYRDRGGFTRIILKSGGGNLSIRQQVFEEGGDHAEYFIEDLFIDAVITPNENTGTAAGTTVSFKVIEPYSMGNFIQAIILAAKEKSYRNYVDAPFCLKIEFTGWDENDQKLVNQVPPKFIPIKFTKIDFNVGSGGSVYQVEAVPMSDTGLEDTIANVKTTINSNGSFVNEMLLTSNNSVTQAYNDHIAGLEDTDILASHDRILIVFPKNNRSVLEFVETGNGPTDEVTGQEQLNIDRGGPDDGLRGTSGNRLVPDDPDTVPTNEAPTERVKPKGEVFRRLEAWATNTQNMNEIGLSKIIEDPNAAGDQVQTDQADSHDSTTDVHNRGTVENSVSETSRTLNSNQGENILRLIDRVVLSSQWAREKSTEETGPTGVRNWFKVETRVFLETDPEAETKNGRPPRYYVYEVLPYFPDEAKFLSNNERPRGTLALMSAAVKEYNYIYTGKNEDILDFDINFNNAFMQTALSDFGANNGGIASTLSDSVRAHFQPAGVTRTNRGQGGTNETGGSHQMASSLNTETAALRSGDVRQQVAHMVHQRMLYQSVDMVTAEMTIWGDPYFIPQILGNYAPVPTSNPMVGADGSMNYGTHEVMIVLNFQNPIDQQKNGPYYDFPQIVRGFSGLFTVRAVENHFNEGKFTQVLKLIRRFGQDDEETTQNTPFIEVAAEQIRENLTGNTVSDTASALSATGNNPNVGYGDGQVDPRLAAAAALQRANQQQAQIDAEAAVGLDAFGGTGSNVTGAAAERGVGLDAFGGSGGTVEGVNTPPSTNSGAPGFR
jgi:hypothetical protein